MSQRTEAKKFPSHRNWRIVQSVDGEGWHQFVMFAINWIQYYVCEKPKMGGWLLHLYEWKPKRKLKGRAR